MGSAQSLRLPVDRPGGGTRSGRLGGPRARRRVHAFDAFEVPNAPGVLLHDILDLSISNPGTIDHVVNGTGPSTPPATVPNDIVSYP